MSDYFSDDRFYEIDIVPALAIRDFKDLYVFVGHDLIPDCDENCLVVINNPSLIKATKICCISLEKPEYYLHGKIDGMEEWILNKEEKQSLINILQTKSNLMSNATAYMAMIGYVNDYNIPYYNRSGFSLPLDYPMPDYTQLPE